MHLIVFDTFSLKKRISNPLHLINPGIYLTSTHLSNLMTCHSQASSNYYSPEMVAFFLFLDYLSSSLSATILFCHPFFRSVHVSLFNSQLKCLYSLMPLPHQGKVILIDDKIHVVLCNNCYILVYFFIAPKMFPLENLSQFAIIEYICFILSYPT